jgi:2-polyprenyl-3-methyl-5-hydroxy-6-metoxy-1,4-benzoquinol methylase
MTVTLTADDEPRVEEFAGSLFMAALAAMELANVELGVRLGLYAVLAEAPRTAAELADAAGIAPRYAREWLEQQAVARVVEADAALDGDARRYTLPAAHAHCLLDDDSEACMKPLAALVPWLSTSLDIMTEELRSGKGVAFGAFDLHDIQAAFTRPVFQHHLVQSWLPAVPDVQASLSAGKPVRIAEVGCGEGLAAIRIAQAYPAVRVDGFDLDDASIAAARKAAAEAGLQDRVQFHHADAGTLSATQPYDLVLSIEMLHDVPDPVAVLRTMRDLAGSAGACLVAEERTKEAFTVDDDPMERFFYAFSTLHCLAVAMQDGGAATGTVIRESTVRDYAAQAGFASVDVLDVDHPQFRLYRLR